MQVHELIAELQKLDEQLEVKVAVNDDEDFMVVDTVKYENDGRRLVVIWAYEP